MIYLFVGEDELSKNIKLEKIKQELFSSQLESFNFEVIYSKELDLKTLQEKLLNLPLKAKQRLILIKDASVLGNEIKQYLLAFLKKPYTHVSLILDVRGFNNRDSFLNNISRKAKVVNFHRSKGIDAFMLARQICQKRINAAMRMLIQLLLQGERPEKIIGAIRYQLDHERLSLEDRKKKLRFLLNCDIDIKTGRLKPRFALEQLFIRLCYF